ncbi:MAG: M48 family metalloprotease [Planctomycetes bacterium]|nr:M48 family metalloprotease [Planctomycetota bacterium]
MGPSVSLFFGLVVVFASREVDPPVPGSGSWPFLLLHLPLLAAPYLLARAARSLLVRELTTGRVASVPPRALLRLSVFATPLVCWAFCVSGGWGDIGSRLAGSSSFVDMMLLLAPLYVAELPRLVVATLAETLVEVAAQIAPGRIVDRATLPGPGELAPSVRVRLSWPILLLMPCALFGLGLDLLQIDRRAQSFFLATSPGGAIGALLFFFVAASLLPLWFRVAFGVVSALPEPIGSRLRQTAAALGFPASRVLLLPTANRAMNAAMVGPLPFGRFLCLTDGILASLDEESLSGVVAHEIGHAKRGHPLLLLTFAIVIPVLLPPILGLWDVGEFDALTKAVMALLALVFVWSIVRTVAHRFEHEADATSVRALGAGPCSRALKTVCSLAMPMSRGFFRRVFSLHPEEADRWAFMARYESDPLFRRRFDERSTALRSLTVALVVITAFGAIAAWIVEWPYERAIWSFRSGDFRSAQAHVATVGDEVPERWQETWQRLREELRVATEIAPDATDWESARREIEGKAFPRALEVLRANGPAAAAPWFALAREVDESPLCGALHEFCRATDDVHREKARRVVRRLGPPPGLEGVFAD